MPVHIAAKMKDLAAVQADFAPGDESKEFGGRPLIFWALSNNDAQRRSEIASFLLDRGARVDGVNSEGDGVLAVLLSRQKTDVAQTTDLLARLLEAGADPTARNARGVTPTQWVAQLPETDEELAPLLDLWFAQPGLQPSAPNEAGKSPLDLVPASRTDRRARMEAYRG